ncbi:MAG: cysteine hydrolase [Clostridiales Family XIII bacterium]|jgi:ureidoacrylate peracid hydrolase|nr:cysteine hydrolase [Clostridiales Family XIII bacterium]
MKPLPLDYLLTKTRKALVLVDVQNEFCHPDGVFGKKGCDLSPITNMMTALERLVPSAREKGVPIVFIQNVEDDNTDSFAWKMRPDAREDSANEGVCRRGSWGTELYGFIPREGDILVQKNRFSGFLNTPLDAILKNKGIETLVFTGVATNICVETTARHALILDYHVILAQDACATFYPDLHEATCKNIRLWFGKVADSKEIVSAWIGNAPAPARKIPEECL